MKKFSYIIIFFAVIVSLGAKPYTNSGTSYCVMERSTKRVLKQSNMHQISLVASTAKIMTAITAIEDDFLFELIEITSKDVNEVGSKVYIQEGDSLTKYDLLHALMLRSGNDAASALSNNNSKDFVYRMNELAKKINMTNSTFANASGLDEKEYNLSTAYDMALLMSYAMDNQIFKDISSKTSYKTCTLKGNHYYWENKHRLVRDTNEFISGKTGYTKKSGRILVSVYEKNDVQLVIVTINDSNDWLNHKEYSKVINNYTFTNVLKKGIYNPIIDDVDYYIYIKKNYFLPLTENEKKKLKIHFELYKSSCILKIYVNDDMIVKEECSIIKH